MQVKQFASMVALSALIFPVTAFANQIEIVFSGSFGLQMHQDRDGQLISRPVSVPFTSLVSIELQSPAFYDYPEANTTQTVFGGPAFDTTLTDSLLSSFSGAPTVAPAVSHSVYWFGYEPVGQRNDFMSSAMLNHWSTDEQFIYQLHIRAPIDVPAADEQGPLLGLSLLAALEYNAATAREFAVTEFYEVYPADGGARIAANWYLGSAHIEHISVVPEPASAFLFLLGLALLRWLPLKANLPRFASPLGAT